MEGVALITLISINTASVVYVISKGVKFIFKVVEFLHEQDKED